MENDKFPCDTCGKRFGTKTILNRHMKIHREKQHSCAECFKTFARKDYLNEHVKVHEKKKNKQLQGHQRQQQGYGMGLGKGKGASVKIAKHECDLCSKEFRRAYDLKIHLVCVHKDERCGGGQCGKCRRGFTRKDRLDLHEENCKVEKKKKKIKQFVCNVCPPDQQQTFNNRDEIIRHKTLRHSLQCKHCPRKFTTERYRIKHQEKCKGMEGRQQCEFCHKIITIVGMEGHIRAHYNDGDVFPDELPKEMLEEMFGTSDIMQICAHDLY